ncbi:MAG: phosphate ABC transporter permease subunit PstC [Pirellulaceae bacterium]|jgi:phosphate transport system permease protein|nr:phosphate ABC transporter permease subunit PstC [Pirellulaceae bacterium]
MARLFHSDRSVRYGLLFATSTSLLIVALIFLFLGKEALPFLANPGLTQLLGTRWIPVSFDAGSFGIVPLFTGTLLVTSLSLVLTVPLGIGAAVYIAELAAPWERRILRPLMELLTAIPTVVIGFFGLVVLGPWIKYLCALPSGMNALTASLLLAVMAFPTVVSVSEEAIRGVPAAWKRPSLALGATPLQTTWRVTVPAAAPGILAAVSLGAGRVVGETMVVLMVTGNAAQLTLWPLKSVRTMTATIALEMGEVALGSHHYRALFCIGVLLLGVTFGLNLVAQRALSRQTQSH